MFGSRQLEAFVVHSFMSPSLPAAATWYDVAPRLGCQLTSAVLFSHSKEALTFVGAQGADRKGKKGEGFVCWQTS